jgi:histidinol dehydrogenase
VGLYIPGGTAPLFSTVLMLGIPAQIAGALEIVLCSPPSLSSGLNPAIIYAASLCGIKNIFKVGGAQAIAAMTFGTESIPRVDKIFGPGNAYVTAAKQEALRYGLAIDMPAGPSELLVIADKFADASFVAADLLSQAEHGVDSQVVLCTDSAELLTQVEDELALQTKLLERAEIASKALSNSFALVFNNLNTCLDFSNYYAPEHLIINTREAKSFRAAITTAGSVFLGPYSAESIGDYASGTNHTLPTAAFARSYSGLSLESFQKQIQFQEVSEKGLKNIGPMVSIMAQAEALGGHQRAVDIRLEKIFKGTNDV